MSALADMATSPGMTTEIDALDPPIPEIVIALDVHREEVVVVRPTFVFRKLDVLLRVRVGLVFAHRLFHRRREILQVGELIAGILLAPDLASAWAGMAGNEALPIHGDHLFQALLDTRNVSIGHAA